MIALVWALAAAMWGAAAGLAGASDRRGVAAFSVVCAALSLTLVYVNAA